MTDQQKTLSVVTHDEARAILSRFNASHWNNPGEHARYSIPADQERDDDIKLTRYIDQNRALEQRVAELVEMNATCIRERVAAVTEQARLQKLLDVCSEVHGHNVKLKRQIEESDRAWYGKLTAADAERYEAREKLSAAERDLSEARERLRKVDELANSPFYPNKRAFDVTFDGSKRCWIRAEAVLGIINGPAGSQACPKCGKDTPHMHDRKGNPVAIQQDDIGGEREELQRCLDNGMLGPTDVAITPPPDAPPKGESASSYASAAGATGTSANAERGDAEGPDYRGAIVKAWDIITNEFKTKEAQRLATDLACVLPCIGDHHHGDDEEPPAPAVSHGLEALAAKWEAEASVYQAEARKHAIPGTTVEANELAAKAAETAVQLCAQELRKALAAQRSSDDVLLARDELCLAAHTHKFNLRYSDRDTLKELEEAACVYASRAAVSRALAEGER